MTKASYFTLQNHIFDFHHTLLGSIVVSAMSWAPPDLIAQTSDSVALSGIVSSQAEGLMEGVVVSARRDGANFTVSVVSDAQGKYSFPRTHMEPGKYALTIRAVGYDLVGPGSVEIAAGKTANANLKLEKTKDLAAQLSSLEWAMSVLGTPEQKDKVIYQTVSCAYCHALERVMKSKHTAGEFVDLITRMQKYYTDGSAVSRDKRGRGRFRTARPTTRSRRCRPINRYGAVNLTGSRKRIWPSTSPR